MDKSEITQVIDQVATKLGVAAEQLEGFGQTLVQEQAAYSEMGFIMGVCLLIGGLSTSLVGLYKERHNARPDDPTWFISCFVGLGGFIIGLVATAINGMEMVAPTIAVLERLL